MGPVLSGEQVRGILAELRRGLEQIYSHRLARLVLYGSYARGEAEPGSDIDALIVLKHPEPDDDRLSSDFVANLCLQHGILVSCKFIDEDRFLNGGGPFLRNVRRDGIDVAGPGGHMSRDQYSLIMRARESVGAARVLLAEGHFGFAASRAYYAMFYAAEALLDSEGMSFNKHSAVTGAFGRLFAQTGRVPAELHRYILDAEKDRLKGDYDPVDSVSESRAAEHIVHAEEFVRAVETLLGEPPAA